MNSSIPTAFLALMIVASVQLIRVICLIKHQTVLHTKSGGRRVFGTGTFTINISEQIENVFGNIPDWNNRKDRAKGEVTKKAYMDIIKRFCADSDGAKKNVCPCDWTGLVGPLTPIEGNNSKYEITQKYPDLKAGGEWMPANCTSRQLAAIIIPFKNRHEQLYTFLAHIHPFLQRQNLGYRILVVEQISPKLFNKAAVMNIGFKEAEKLDQFDCFIFHDVDLLPEDDRQLYMCTDKPGHIGYRIRKFNYTLPYGDLFGGATAFTPSQFHRLNGFSNLFWGWGGEDDDMFRRVYAARYPIIRFPGHVSRHTDIPHTRDNPVNHKNVIGFRLRPLHYPNDGLNSLEYTLHDISLHPLVTWIRVSIPK